MKNLFKLSFLLLFISIFSACNSGTATSDQQIEEIETATEVTTIYLVRHAEKDTTDASNEDPELTEVGHARAEALRTLLEGQEVDALYATKYMRTGQTLYPLAKERNMEVVQYEGHDFEGLKARILEEHRGETVVVAGHSNTLLPIIEAFGVTKPFEEIADSQYRYLFKLTVRSDNTASVEVSEFGA
ncbi:histidine phosphatase family protein [Pontibacter virosus]|uniref:Histidine phosphatase superfamily protein (Branch 1) n=1 Tax=Pontibacter virosus TaxID=1765052 RepID=A0A2U1B2Z4_9BACT|nr:phosphoglycerate mutase family protein [Pontibacter virosus]PVY43054.1 histidine phosphatase superfamily protein (branch 1) [Pontibacter virosus]